MASYEPDRDYGDENAYDVYTQRTRGDLCELCRNDLVAEGEDLCHSCIQELGVELVSTDEPDLEAYELVDPKHPRHHDVMSEAA